MADWGLLAGLGEAMKGFGNAWSDKSTAELKERLAREREDRAMLVRMLRKHVSVSRKNLLLLRTKSSVTQTVLHGEYLITSLVSLLVNVS